MKYIKMMLVILSIMCMFGCDAEPVNDNEQKKKQEYMSDDLANENDMIQGNEHGNPEEVYELSNEQQLQNRIEEIEQRQTTIEDDRLPELTEKLENAETSLKKVEKKTHSPWGVTFISIISLLVATASCFIVKKDISEIKQKMHRKPNSTQ